MMRCVGFTGACMLCNKLVRQLSYFGPNNLLRVNKGPPSPTGPARVVGFAACRPPPSRVPFCAASGSEDRPCRSTKDTPLPCPNGSPCEPPATPGRRATAKFSPQRPAQEPPPPHCHLWLIRCHRKSTMQSDTSRSEPIAFNPSADPVPPVMHTYIEDLNTESPGRHFFSMTQCVSL